MTSKLSDSGKLWLTKFDDKFEDFRNNDGLKLKII
jgi:hypothetical protein